MTGTMKRLLLLVALVCTARLGAEEGVKPDDTARFLAGLPVRGTALEALARQTAWAEHATEFDKAWKELDARQLAKIRAWGPEFLGAAFTAKEPVFYFFSGPDILYAQTFFPNAATYVLCGLEPVGAVPEVEHLPPAALAAGLANLRKSMNSALSFSFFITKEMKVDLRSSQLSGTLPILYVFLARAGSRIDQVQLLGLTPNGGTSPLRAETPGVKINFTSAGGAAQTLYYFTTDLANDGIRREPGFIRFCEGLGAGRSLVKAASYLLHMEEFSKAREFLLAHSTTLVEDDSGIPLRDFEAGKWSLRYFGAYPGPIELFKQHYQPEMADAYKVAHAPELPFGFGYRWHPRESSLIIATPK